MTQRILLLDSLRSMNNVGAIFRTMDGAGWDKIILTGYTPTPPRKEIAKTALGAEKSVPWEYYEDPTEAIKDLKKQGYTILAAEKNESSTDYKSHESGVMSHESICLIVGNEVDGVQKALLDTAHHIIHLPMRGMKSSLNVAVATGVLLYHFADDK